ncbi:hypothetical protein [Nocardia sp. NPDC004711]
MPFIVNLTHQDRRIDLRFDSGEFDFLEGGVLKVQVSDDEVRYFAPGFWTEVRHAREL